MVMMLVEQIVVQVALLLQAKSAVAEVDQRSSLAYL
jgi:hypothetical protein